MDKHKFDDYFNNMFSEIYTDKKTILALKYCYELYREGRSTYVTYKYSSKKDAKKMIEPYVRARMLIENLMIDIYPLEIVDEKLSDIDYAITHTYFTKGRVKKEFNEMSKKFLAEEGFAENEIIRIFKIYNEIIEHDPIIANTIVENFQDQEKLEMIEQYKNNINRRIKQYINDL